MLVQEDTLVMVRLPTVYFVGTRTTMLLKAGLNMHRATSKGLEVEHPKETGTTIPFHGQRLRVYTSTTWRHWYVYTPYPEQVIRRHVAGVSEVSIANRIMKETELTPQSYISRENIFLK